MADVMLKLGNFAFSIDTAAYQRLNRSTAWTWASQARVGAHEALQYTGKGADTITLDGVIYPGWKGGTGQIEAMRAQADRHEPLILVDGNGFVHGRWVIESVNETGSLHALGGAPRRQRFTIQIRHYDDGPTLSIP